MGYVLYELWLNFADVSDEDDDLAAIDNTQLSELVH
jgi:hypothetical protein